MPKSKIPQEIAVSALQDILTHFKPTLNGHGGPAFYEAVTEKINQFAEESWTRRYIQSVDSGTVEPSQKFAAAVVAFATRLDDSNLPDLIIRSESLTVHAMPGNIKPGSYIMGSSRNCFSPTCRVVFVPNNPLRKYCPSCRPPKVK